MLAAGDGLALEQFVIEYAQLSCVVLLPGLDAPAVMNDGGVFPDPFHIDPVKPVSLVVSIHHSVAQIESKWVQIFGLVLKVC